MSWIFEPGCALILQNLIVDESLIKYENNFDQFQPICGLTSIVHLHFEYKNSFNTDHQKSDNSFDNNFIFDNAWIVFAISAHFLYLNEVFQDNEEINHYDQKNTKHQRAFHF
jgi:hypothetical protein